MQTNNHQDENKMNLIHPNQRGRVLGTVAFIRKIRSDGRLRRWAHSTHDGTRFSSTPFSFEMWGLASCACGPSISGHGLMWRDRRFLRFMVAEHSHAWLPGPHGIVPQKTSERFLSKEICGLRPRPIFFNSWTFSSSNCRLTIISPWSFTTCRLVAMRSDCQL